MNKIILGDCLKAMYKIDDNSIDMILCDMPYGTTACKWDAIIDLNKMWDHYKRIIKSNGAIVLTASQPFTTILISSNIKMFKYCWYWDKINAGSFVTAKYRPLSVFEDVCIFSNNNNRVNYFPIMERAKTKYKRLRNAQYKRKEDNSNAMQSGVFKVSKNHNESLRYPKNRLVYNNRVGELNALKRIHPTQKPVKLFEYLIKTYTKKNELVLDNCAGSGTTGIACLNLKRKFILIEKDKEYYNVMRKRLKDYMKG